MFHYTIRELFSKYQFGAKHTANVTPGKVVVCSAESESQDILFITPVISRGVMHVCRQSKSQTTEKSGTINVVTFAAANLLCTNQTWGRANEVSDIPREVTDNWGHAILSWAIPSNGQAPGRETPLSGDD